MIVCGISFAFKAIRVLHADEEAQNEYSFTSEYRGEEDRQLLLLLLLVVGEASLVVVAMADSV